MKLALRSALALAAVFGLALPLSAGCSSSMDPKECDKLRGDAFELLNKAQHCNGDQDCRESDWPGCEKPESNETNGKIAPMRDAFRKGKCEEKPPECPKETPPVYCKQGLCVHREKGTPEGAGNTPSDQIIIQ